MGPARRTASRTEGRDSAMATASGKEWGGSGRIPSWQPLLMGTILFVAGAFGDLWAARTNPLDAGQRDWLAEWGPVRYCVDPDWMPMEQIDDNGRHVGLAADFLSLMARRAGVELELVTTADWSESLDKARRRDCDLLSMAMETPGRAEYMDFTEPYLEIPSVIVTRGDAPWVEGLAYVLDQPLGIMRDFSFVELYRERYPELELREVDDYEQGLLKVQRGELFGFLGNMANVSMTLQRSGMSNLKIAGRIEGDSRLSVATRNDEPQLGAIFSALVRSINDADRRELFNRWIPVHVEQTRDQELTWEVLLPVTGLALIALVWSERVRRLNRRLEAANRKLEALNREDTLTGLHNRLHLDEKLEEVAAYCARNRVTLSVAMVDLDFFKSINDRFGHPYGDQCLRQVARVLSEQFQRETDTVVRYGGEEFVVLVSGTKRPEFAERLERTRQEVSRLVAVRDDSRQLHVSIGAWCGVPSGTGSPYRYLSWADQALYRAKTRGRNRVVVASEPDTGEVSPVLQVPFRRLI